MRALMMTLSNRGKTRLWSLRGLLLFVFLVLSRSATFRVSGAIAVSSFMCLWSYRGRRQILAIERKELKTITVQDNEFLMSFGRELKC